MEQLAQLERGISGEIAPMLQMQNIKRANHTEQSKTLRRIKAEGFSDARIATLLGRAGVEGVCEQHIRKLREDLGVFPVFRSVDTCAGEYVVLTSYYYSTYDAEQGDSMRALPKAPSKELRRVMILGGGPNRIGQGVEFDYCCVQAAFALKEAGIISIMVNSNPETVSTDYDTANVLYFEPLTVEDIIEICRLEQPDGLIVQFGGQTPLNLSAALEAEGIPIIGTSPAGIALAEDRKTFNRLMQTLNIAQPPSGMAHNEESACRIAKSIGYPVMVRPSFVLGGRAMRIIQDEASLREYVGGKNAGLHLHADNPILVDRFLEDAIEVDVDAVVDGKNVTVAAIMEHIEQAGIHSGDSCCSIPTHTLSLDVLEKIRNYTRRIGIGLNTVGLLNIQFAVRDEEVFVLEANPRASRTVPFVSKATGVPVARIATKVMCGASLQDVGFVSEPRPAYHAMKEAVLPFDRFPGSEISLGPEMRSTGEVMGIDKSFGMAFLKAESAAGSPIPFSGNIVLSVTDRDKEPLLPLAKRLVKLGFKLYATPGTKNVLEAHGVITELVVKIGAKRPHLLDFIRNGEVNMLVNTVSGSKSAADATTLRAEALGRHVTTLTTIAALRAAVEGLEARLVKSRSVAPLQDYYAMSSGASF